MPSFFNTYKVYDAAFSEGVFEQLMIALACFLSFMQFLISSLYPDFKSCLENSYSYSSISDNCHEKKEKILPNSAFTGVAQNAFLKEPNVHFFKGELS